MATKGAIDEAAHFRGGYYYQVVLTESSDDLKPVEIQEFADEWRY